MNDLRNKREFKPLEVTAAALKWYGCITMLLYTISIAVLQNGLLHVRLYSSTEMQEILLADSSLMRLSSIAVVFQILAGLAVPVFAFLLVEGFQRTGNFKNYLLRMLGFGLISELPFDFAMKGTWIDWSSQNMLLTLTICLVMLYGLRMFPTNKGFQAMIVLAAAFWCALFKTQFGLGMVLMAAVYYLLREKQDLRVTLGGLIGLLYITGPLSNFLLRRYNGKQGNVPNKYLFYVLYPLHLLVLGIISAVIA